MLLGEWLRRAGHDAVEAADGEAALELLRTAALAEPFDLVLTDVRMGGIGGLDMLAAMPDPRPPVVLVTGYVDEVLVRAARDIGAAAVLGKPFDLAELLRVTEHLVGDSAFRARAPAA